MDPAVAVLVDVQNMLCRSAPCCGTAPVSSAAGCLPRLATGTVGAYALSEKQSGSDAFAVETTACRDVGYRLTGAQSSGRAAPPGGRAVRRVRPPPAPCRTPG